MYYALNENGERIHAKSAQTSNHYFCPACSSPMILKQGAIVSAHFSHISKVMCDPWYEPKSAWHREWQAKFHDSNCEQVISIKGIRHIADVSMGNVIIEFQHSSMPIDEFQARSLFYTFGGRKLIWLIDCRSDFANKRIICTDTDSFHGWQHYRWEHPKRYLAGVKPCGPRNIDVFLQIDENRLLQVKQIAGDLNDNYSYKAFFAIEGQAHHFIEYANNRVKFGWVSPKAEDNWREYCQLLSPADPKVPIT